LPGLGPPREDGESTLGAQIQGVIEGAKIQLLVPMSALECFSSPPMLMISISYKQLLLWHITGHIQFTTSNFQNL